MKPLNQPKTINDPNEEVSSKYSVNFIQFLILRNLIKKESMNSSRSQPNIDNSKTFVKNVNNDPNYNYVDKQNGQRGQP